MKFCMTHAVRNRQDSTVPTTTALQHVTCNPGVSSEKEVDEQDVNPEGCDCRRAGEEHLQ